MADESGSLHLSGVTTDGHLWHTIRRPDGSWIGFGDVEAQTGDRGSIVDVDIQLVRGELHLCAVSSEGRLWHTIRRVDDGSWLPFRDVEGQAGDRGRFAKVGVAEGSNRLHVCGVTTDGRLWHTIRNANGSWVGFGDVESQASDRGRFVDVACVGVHNLHVCGVTDDGHLWHTIRRVDGSWFPFGDVEAQTGDRGRFVTVGVAEGSNEPGLHVCGVTTDGHLWHTIRHPDGSWTSFEDVEAQTGDRGRFVTVGVAEGSNEPGLHVCGVTTHGRLWHTIRHPDGSWTSFEDVEAQTGDRGRFRAVSAAVYQEVLL